MTVNVQEELNNSINILLDTNKHVGEFDHAFDVIEEYIDNIDYANGILIFTCIVWTIFGCFGTILIINIVSDFQKLGGFQVFIPGLKSPEPTVRAKTAKLIGSLVQNNPYCQEKFIEHPTYINLLMNVVENDIEIDVRTKALYAISCKLNCNKCTFLFCFF